MPKRLWKFIEEWRSKGIAITDEDADDIYRLCMRKMEVSGVKNPDEYINLLYPDEIRHHLFRASVNATTILRMIGMEANKDVFCMYADTVPSTVS